MLTVFPSVNHGTYIFGLLDTLPNVAQVLSLRNRTKRTFLTV